MANSFGEHLGNNAKEEPDRAWDFCTLFCSYWTTRNSRIHICGPDPTCEVRLVNQYNRSHDRDFE